MTYTPPCIRPAQHHVLPAAKDVLDIENVSVMRAVAKRMAEEREVNSLSSSFVPQN